MRRTVSIAALLVLVTTAVQAGPPFACCVCVAPNPAEPPLSCLLVDGSQTADFEAGCTLQGGMPNCLASISPNCSSEFASAGCERAAAPAVGNEVLLAMAVLLGGVGALTLHTRRSRSV